MQKPDITNFHHGQIYLHRDKNDIHKSVQLLDQFTKSFCVDAEVKEDLVFRCHECPFLIDNRICLIKSFKCDFCPDYKDFGAMGDL